MEKKLEDPSYPIAFSTLEGQRWKKEGGSLSKGLIEYRYLCYMGVVGVKEMAFFSWVERQATETIQVICDTEK
jgi:hypothetical protein